jgi:hypothetical protein
MGRVRSRRGRPSCPQVATTPRPSALLRVVLLVGRACSRLITALSTLAAMAVCVCRTTREAALTSPLVRRLVTAVLALHQCLRPPHQPRAPLAMEGVYVHRLAAAGVVVVSRARAVTLCATRMCRSRIAAKIRGVLQAQHLPLLLQRHRLPLLLQRHHLLLPQRHPHQRHHLPRSRLGPHSRRE